MTRRLTAAAIIAAVAAVYLLRLDHAAGLYVDDAWYIVLAKALAGGDGYRLISSAATPILPAFPPGFALLLAPVFVLNPSYPGNLLWLKAVSIAAMLGVGIVTYLYLHRYRSTAAPHAAAVAVITALTPAFVFLATSTVMAECAFTLAQLATALLVERAARAGRSATADLDAGMAGALAAATMLIRVAGLPVLIAGALYLAAKRSVRSAIAFGVVAVLCCLPWAVYSARNAPTTEEREAHGGSIAYAYSDLLAMKYGGDANSGRVGPGDLAERATANVANIFGRDVGAVIFPAAYRGPRESGQEVFQLSGETGFRAGSMGLGNLIVPVSSVISLIAVIGYITAARRAFTVAELLVPIVIAMVAFVPARTFRYVLPLAPFIIYYFLGGIEVMAAWLTRARGGNGASASALRVSLLCVLLLLGMEHGQYVWSAAYGTRPEWLQDQDEVMSVIDWMNAHLTSPAGVTSSNPGLIYLLTGRKGVAMAMLEPEVHIQRWQALGIRYAAALHVAEKPAGDLGYKVLFESPRLKLWVLELPQP